jgi:uncharacterized membrane protein
MVGKLKLFHGLLIFAFLSLLAGPAVAQTANETNGTIIRVYEVIAEIRSDGFVDHRVSFSLESPPKIFRHVIFSKIDNFRYETSPSARCQTQQIVLGTQITCEFDSLPQFSLITFFFTSQDSTKKQAGVWFFQSDYKAAYPIHDATVSVKLPEGAILAKQADIAAFSPTNGETRSDGRRIIVIWQRTGIEASESLVFSIIYENVRTVPAELYIGGLAILAIVIGGAIYILRKRKPESNGTSVLEVLTPEETRVIDIIRAGGGKVIQKKVVVETDFSKAKVSRIVKNLQNRKIISVEPAGRENMLILRTGIIPEKRAEEKEHKTEQKGDQENKKPDSSPI